MTTGAVDDYSPPTRHGKLSRRIVSWADIHPEVKHLLIDPRNDTGDTESLVCGCSCNWDISQNLRVILCLYHLGWQDALDGTAALRILGAGR